MHAVQKICKKQLWHHGMNINHNSLYSFFDLIAVIMYGKSIIFSFHCSEVTAAEMYTASQW